jgi:hypothetical protein
MLLFCANQKKSYSILQVGACNNAMLDIFYSSYFKKLQLKINR